MIQGESSDQLSVTSPSPEGVNVAASLVLAPRCTVTRVLAGVAFVAVIVTYAQPGAAAGIQARTLPSSGSRTRCTTRAATRTGWA